MSETNHTAELKMLNFIKSHGIEYKLIDDMIFAFNNTEYIYPAVTSKDQMFVEILLNGMTITGAYVKSGKELNSHNIMKFINELQTMKLKITKNF